MLLPKPLLGGLVAMAMALSVSAASATVASSITIYPTADGELVENGDGNTGLSTDTQNDVLRATQSGPLSTTIALEFDISGITQSAVTGIQLIMTQFSNSGTSPGTSLLKVLGHAGDGVITQEDISSDFSALGTLGTALDSNVVDNTVDLPWRTQHVFDIVPASLFALSGSRVTLRVNASDSDSVTGFAFFALESVAVDYDLIAQGVQGGVPAQLVFTTMAPVPEPASVAMMLAGLAIMGSVVRRRARTAA